jgi:hypothetical protein
MHYKIYIIQQYDSKRQVQYTWIAVSVNDTKQEAIDFAMAYEYWLEVEVREGGECVLIKKDNLVDKK